VETLPYLEDGTPFPTQLYLSCPSAVSELGRLESQHGVDELRRLVRDEPALRVGLLDLRERYRHRRLQLLPPDFDAEQTLDRGQVREAGIGGPQDPSQATCLHAYAAAVLTALEGPPQILRRDEVPPTVLASWRALLARFGNLWCSNGWCRAFLRDGQRRAAIDVGTNSVRLLVADHFPGFGPRTLLRQAEVTQLGAGVATTGRLGAAGRERTAAAVEAYAREARSLGAGQIVLVATSAARDAADGAEYITHLGHAFGLHALIVSGEMEARLSYAGATLDVPENPVFIDPGGGSTELVRRQGGDLLAISLDIGAVRATDRWIEHDPPLAEERSRVREEALAAFRPLRDRFARGQGEAQLVGVAGTVTTLACQILRLDEYDSDRVHLTRMTHQELLEQSDRLAALTNEERSCLSCMQKGRERVIVAGADIVAAALEVFGYDCLLVSERDILDGIIMSAEELVAGSRPPGP
jgi:exopolyphosphatase/guanosine-5'-triphosphate,3'-diphosphate pyrophosphatase